MDDTFESVWRSGILRIEDGYKLMITGFFKILILLALLTGTSAALYSDIPNPLTVALIPELYPISFINSSGEPDGIYPRTIREIARENGVTLDWSIASWGENLEKARNGEIDLMIGLIYTQERDKFLDYGRVSVVSTWSQLFQAREGVIRSILDVEGKRIGMMIGDQNATAFVELASSFNIHYEAMYYDDFETIYQELVSGTIDAGVFVNVYQLNRPDLISTSILFQPTNSYFAVPQGADDEILRIIDRTLADWKEDEDSFYFREITDFFRATTKPVFPIWLKYLFLGLVVTVLLTLFWLWTLRRQVRQRTVALLNAQEVYRSTFIDADLGMSHVDTGGHLLRVNPWLCSYLGYDERSLLKKSISELTYPDDYDANAKLFLEIVDGKRTSYNMEKRYVTAAGNVVWGHLNVTGIKDTFGNLQYLVAIVEDITSRKNAENQIEDLQKRYRGVFENSYQMTALFDNVGGLLDVNDTLKSVFGIKLEQEEIIGRVPSDIDLLGPIGSLRIQEMVEDCLSTGQTIRHMIDIDETGIGKALDVTVKPILNNNQKIQYCVTEAHDVTDLMTLTNNLEQQVEERTRDIRDTQQKLLEAEKMASLGRLVAGIAHEINTPVGVAKTGVSYLKEQVEETQKKFTEQTLSKDDFHAALESFSDLSAILEQNLDRAIKLIRDFKMTSADQSSHEVRAVPVAEYIEAVMHSLSPQLRKTSVKWRVDAPGEEMLLNVGAINQILVNLTINSLSHAFNEKEEGEILISYRQENGRVIFSFNDNGHGIPSEIQDKVFEPFFTTGRGKGFTGLGLSIIYNLVNDVLHGDIECRSADGKGTTFIIDFPYIQS